MLNNSCDFYMCWEPMESLGYSILFLVLESQGPFRVWVPTWIAIFFLPSLFT